MFLQFTWNAPLFTAVLKERDTVRLHTKQHRDMLLSRPYRVLMKALGLQVVALCSALPQEPLLEIVVARSFVLYHLFAAASCAV